MGDKRTKDDGAVKQLENKWASYLNEQSEVLEPMSFLDSAMKDR